MSIENDAKPLLVVDHGTSTESARGADAFARFYLTQFYQEILDASVKNRRGVYRSVAVIAGLLMILGVVPFILHSASIFALLLLIMSGVLLAAVVFCLYKIRQAPTYCKEHLPEFFESQIASSKRADRRTTQSKFYANHLQIMRGEGAQAKGKQRAYEEIPRVYETDDIYFFQGMGWVHKERLSESEKETLAGIIVKSFASDRYKWVEVIID